MKRFLLIAIVATQVIGLGPSVAAGVDEKPEVALGRGIFDRVCAPCHGKGLGNDGALMLPGSAALAARYQGKLSPFLEDRSDLSAEALKFFVRHGIGAMPMFRKTEITDAQIAAIAAYLSAAK